MDADARTKGEARNFRGICPEHGARFRQHMGRHSTWHEKFFKGLRFNEVELSRIENAITPEDLRHFNRCFHGHSIPSQEDVDRWLGHARPYRFTLIADGGPIYAACGPVAFRDQFGRAVIRPIRNRRRQDPELPRPSATLR
jgi:hypothetical protein